MASTGMARRAYAQVFYSGTDISADISKSLLELNYSDNIDKADDLQITLEDRNHNWCGAWFPEANAELNVTIIAEAWDGGTSSIDCGSFYIDSMDYADGADGTVATIAASSIPLDSPAVIESHSQGWEDTTLSEIAGEIAGRSGLSLAQEFSDDPKMDRMDQRQETDLTFIERIGKEHGISTKVQDGKLILFDEAEYESRAPIFTFGRGDGCLLSIQMKRDSSNVVSSATNSYKDPKSGKLVEDEFSDIIADGIGKVLNINTRPSDLSGDEHRKSGSSEKWNDTSEDFSDIRADVRGSAKQKAKSAARQQNKSEWSCSLSCVGIPGMYSGATFAITGYGQYDGTYIAQSVNHTLSATEYTTAIEGHRTLIGY